MVEVRILRYSIQHTPFTSLLALQRNCLSNWIIYSPFLKTVLAGRDFLNFVSDSNFFPVVSKSLMKFRETTLCRSLHIIMGTHCPYKKPSCYCGSQHRNRYFTSTLATISRRSGGIMSFQKECIWLSSLLTKRLVLTSLH